MAETARVTRDEDQGWQLAQAFMRVMIVELNDALKDCNIDKAALRRKICARFGFGMGNFFDQYWMEVEGKKYYPLLFFSEKFLDAGMPLKQAGKLHGPAKEVELHGMADETAEWFFKEVKEDDTAVPMGYVGQEEAEE